jgi:hypothetical protein
LLTTILGLVWSVQKASKAGKKSKDTPKAGLTEEVSSKVQEITLTVVKKLAYSGGEKLTKKAVEAAIAKEVGDLLVEKKVVEVSLHIRVVVPAFVSPVAPFTHSHQQ